MHKSGKEEAKPSETNAERNRKLLKKSTFIILLGVFIMVSLTIWVVNQSPSLKDQLESEKPVERQSRVNLLIYQNNNSQEFIKRLDNVKSGSNLAFALSSNVPIHAGLALSTNELSANILIADLRMPPGENKMLDSGGVKYRYEVKSKQTILKFCVIYAITASELRIKLQGLDNVWDTLDDSQCVLVNVN